jgi:HK97 family phage portal protein
MQISLKAAFTSLGRNLGLFSPQLISFIGGGITNAGERVSVDTALQLETVWACVRLIASTLSTLPAQFYAKDAQGRGTIAYGHPLYTLLHDQPNYDMTAVVFWECMCACLLLWGNAYARIFRNGQAQIVAITPIKPDRIKATRRGDGTIIYTVTSYGQNEDVPETEIMHVKGFSLDGMIGLSPVSQARETLGLAMAAEKAAASLFRNGMRPAFALTSPNVLTESQRKKFKDEYMPEFTGAINAGRSPLLEGGWDIKNIAMNPADAQLLSTRAFSIEQICRWFGVQPVMIGHMEKSTAWGSGLEQMNLWFLTYTLRSILRSFEQEIRRSLLTPVQRPKFYCEFNVEGLLRADSAGRAALLKVYAENGLRTRNELRALDNMPPLEGGDDLTIMSNMIPASMLGQVARLPLEKPVPGPFDPTAIKPGESQGTENANP